MRTRPQFCSCFVCQLSIYFAALVCVCYSHLCLFPVLLFIFVPVICAAAHYFCFVCCALCCYSSFCLCLSISVVFVCHLSSYWVRVCVLLALVCNSLPFDYGCFIYYAIHGYYRFCFLLFVSFVFSPVDFCLCSCLRLPLALGLASHVRSYACTRHLGYCPLLMLSFDAHGIAISASFFSHNVSFFATYLCACYLH